MPTALPTPWPERAGRRLDAGGVVDLGVARGLRAPGAQRLEVVELQAVAGEVELDVEGQARVAHRQHEPVAADPVRVGRVVPQPLLEEQVGGRAPGSSPCRGGRCRPSGRRPWPARATVSIARRSRSPKPSGRVGCGWAGLPVGASVAASAGASDPVLCVMWWVLPRGRPGVVGSASVCGRPGRRGPGLHRRRRRRALPAARAASTLINPSHPRSCRAVPGPARATVAAVPIPGSKRTSVLSPPVVPRVRAARPVTALSERPGRSPPAAVVRARLGAYVALTKPRIIELLLVTTVPAMMLAAGGWPSWRLLLAHAGRRHARGRRGQRLQLLLRPRHRQADAPHRSGVRCRRARSARGRR